MGSGQNSPDLGERVDKSLAKDVTSLNEVCHAGAPMMMPEQTGTCISHFQGGLGSLSSLAAKAPVHACRRTCSLLRPRTGSHHIDGEKT